KPHRGIDINYPYKTGDNLFFFPDLSPQIKKTDKGQIVYFKIYNILPESKNPPIRLELQNSDGKPAEIQQFGLLQRPNNLEHGGLELVWKLLALPDVPPGSYHLRVDISDTTRNTRVSRETKMDLRL